MTRLPRPHQHRRLRQAQVRYKLLGQRELAIDIEVAADRWRSSIRLAATDADGVVTSGNDRVAIFSDHDQIAVLQVEVDLLARARLQMDFLESAESDLRRTLDCGELDVDLDGLISCNFPRVGYRDIGGDRLPRSYSLRGTLRSLYLKVV